MTAIPPSAENAGAYVPVSGGVMTGPLVLPGDPSTALQAATKQYVDAKINCSPVFVQQTPNVSATATGGGSTVSVPVTLATNTSSGNTLFAVVSSVGTSGGASSTISGVTDSLGNTYAILGTTGLSETHYAVYYATNIVGGTDTVTEAVSGSTPNGTITVYEYHNIAERKSTRLNSSHLGISY